MKRKLIEAAGWAALALAIGIYGGAECDLLPLGRAAAEAIGLMGAGAFLLWKAGVLQV